MGWGRGAEVAEVVCDARDDGAFRVLTGAPDTLVPTTPRTSAFLCPLREGRAHAVRDCAKRPGSEGVTGVTWYGFGRQHV